jgi:nanoRNase/pAp phosphatase (c-di-AMP/oligoRNAs hydrolase)
VKRLYSLFPFSNTPRGIGAVVYVEEEMNDPTKYKISLRSLRDEDTTLISTAHGGGGHKNASSFSISIKDFNMFWIVSYSDR